MAHQLIVQTISSRLSEKKGETKQVEERIVGEKEIITTQPDSATSATVPGPYINAW